MSLVPLSEFNNKMLFMHSIVNDPLANGIACPQCGKELYDKNPNVTLLTDPPRKSIICLGCDYTGYRYC